MAPSLPTVILAFALAVVVLEFGYLHWTSPLHINTSGTDNGMSPAYRGIEGDYFQNPATGYYHQYLTHSAAAPGQPLVSIFVFPQLATDTIPESMLRLFATADIHMILWPGSGHFEGTPYYVSSTEELEGMGSFVATVLTEKEKEKKTASVNVCVGWGLGATMLAQAPVSQCAFTVIAANYNNPLPPTDPANVHLALLSAEFPKLPLPGFVVSVFELEQEVAALPLRSRMLELLVNPTLVTASPTTITLEVESPQPVSELVVQMHSEFRSWQSKQQK